MADLAVDDRRSLRSPRVPRLPSVVLTIVLTFVAVEGIARLALVGLGRFGPDPRANADGYAGETWPQAHFKELRGVKFEWEPYVTWRHRPFEGTAINIDSEGLRRTWRVAGDGPRRRIWIFGGSTVFGVGARDDYTLPSALARGLASAGIPADVTNFGQTGYVTGQDVTHLWRRLKEGEHPDLVILYGAASDILAAWQSGRAGHPQNEANRRVEFNAMQPERLGAAWSILTAGLRRLLTGSAVSPPVMDEEGEDRLAREIVERYVADVRAVHALSVEYGFDAVVVRQPLVRTKPSRTPFEEGQLGRFNGLWPLHDRAWRMMTDSPELRAQNWFDASTVFAGTREPVFVDAFHLTELGYQRVADALLPAVVGALGRRH